MFASFKVVACIEMRERGKEMRRVVWDSKKLTSSSNQDSSGNFIFKTTSNDGSYHVQDLTLRLFEIAVGELVP